MANEEKKIAKSNRSGVKKIISFFLSLVIIFSIGFLVLNYVPFISRYQSYVVISPSMVPVININDVVIVDSSVKAEDLIPGEKQIIAFMADISDDGIDNPVVVVHYFDSKYVENGVTVYKTISNIGDKVDDWVLTADDIIGLKVLTIPKIGRILQFTQSTFGRIILISDIIIIYLAIEIINPSKKEETKLENNGETPEDSNIQ